MYNTVKMVLGDLPDMLNRSHSAGELEANNCKTGLYINSSRIAKEVPGDARHCLEIYH